ncbi:hypothetical protein UGMREWDR_CDS0114 [Aeromonas phage GomatiRiver_11]|nr:hypothetical protein OBDJBBDK_00107 [Aeromonas phage AhFM11]WKW84281.1 hypothetical protein UGMREWDR_CDS0114 [Aeromonas phage GomatiRiver_11]
MQAEQNFDVDLTEDETTLSDHYDIDMMELQERLQEQAEKKAAKHLKKHGRELKRLKKHAERALFANNREQYMYAIDKLRVLYKQKALPTDVMSVMFDTSRAQIVDMAKAFNSAAKL